MADVQVAVPEELLALLEHSQLGELPAAEQVRVALAIHLLQESVISAGKAADIAGMSRAEFELLLGEMGIPAVRYDVGDYEQDRQALQCALDRA